MRAVVILLVSCLAWLGMARGEDGLAKPKTGLAVWDTGRPSPKELTLAALAGTKDWTAIPIDKTASSFTGDAVVSNGRIAVVVRREDSAAEVYSLVDGAAALRSRLRLLSANGDWTERLDRLAL